VKLPDGWKSNYLKLLRGWEFTKYTPGPDGLNESNDVGVRELSDTDPRNADDFAAKLKEKDFLDIGKVWTQVTERGRLPDGFYVKGVVADTEDRRQKPALGLVVVRKVGGLTLRCKSSNLRSEALRTEAIELVTSARFGP
jgi:hypothetical protein